VPPGASYGPRSIRRATEHYLSYHGEFQVDLFDALGLADCGDISIVPGNASGRSSAPSGASRRSTRPAPSRSSSAATTPARSR
jgi:arginase family enzyme